MRPGASLRVVSALAMATAFVSSAARAQEPASALALDAPEGCPDGAELREEVATLVGRPIDEIALPLGVDPRIVVTPEASRFVLEVHDPEGDRTLRDASCAALVRAAALIIALRIDADAATLAAAAAAEPPPPPPPPPPRRYTPHYVFDAFEWSRRLGDPLPPRVLPSFSFGVGAFVEGGIVPVASASLALDFVLREDRFEGRLRGTYVFEQAQPRPYGVAAQAMMVSGLACGRPFSSDFALALCGGFEGGTIVARSYGVALPTASTAWTVAVVVGAWLPLFPWRSIDVSLGIEGWARIYRPDFAIQGLGHVWDSDPFGGRFGLLVHLAP